MDLVIFWLILFSCEGMSRVRVQYREPGLAANRSGAKPEYGPGGTFFERICQRFLCKRGAIVRERRDPALMGGQM